ncbi:MAG: MotA/TolQ/ExbB proton channel family protein [Fretibacterium sp.]|nr:MotA/TolQ/ExbB proton channel family protein [Fretibacterium sp.]
MLEYMRAGGSIMWVIAFLSVVALAVALERLFFYWRARTDPQSLEAALSRALRSGDMEAARQLTEASDSSLHRLFAAVLSAWDLPSDAMKLLAEQQVRRELYRWEKHLPILEAVGRIAPLLGLLGTVVGMVEMFSSLHLGAAIDTAAVTGGIGKALYTTVAGLAVAIPTMLVYSLLQGFVDSEAETLERGSDFLLRERLICDSLLPES